jgi:hypothetical protein
MQINFHVSLSVEACGCVRLRPVHSYIWVGITVHIRDAIVIVDCQVCDIASEEVIVNCVGAAADLLTTDMQTVPRITLAVRVYLFTCRLQTRADPA